MFRKNEFYFTFIKKRLLGKVKKVSGAIIIATDAYSTNYYHFTAESLPRIFSVLGHFKNAKLLLHKDSPDFVQQYLALLGITNICFVNDDELVLAENLLLPMHTADGLFQNPILIQKLATYFENKSSFT